VTEWLESLKGEKGDQGNPGEDGEQGPRGGCSAATLSFPGSSGGMAVLAGMIVIAFLLHSKLRVKEQKTK